jgi:hypothetical protein
MMTYSTATVADVTAFRGREFAPGEFRRAVFGTFFIGVGSITAIGAMTVSLAVAAAWIVAGLHSDNSDFQVKRPFALGAAALTKLETTAFEKTYRGVEDAIQVSAAARDLIPPASVNTVKLLIFRAPAAQAAVAAPRVASLQSPDQTKAMPVAAIPVPAPRPAYAPQLQAAREFARASSGSAAPEVTGSISKQTAALSGSSLQRLVAPQAAHSDSPLLANVDDRTAIYDIEAHVVYLPNGDRIEAHSGLGQWLDDPHHVNIKDRGATPPNVYDLALRDGLFHGVEAIRLTPVGDNNMYGRDGILAHPYMLGPSGQSFGCVSFRDYEQFLRAFKRGEVDRIVVVPHLDAKPPATVRASRDGTGRFAFN